MLSIAQARLVGCLAAVVAVATAMPACAKTPGSNGRIAFTRFDADVGDQISFLSNPEEQLFAQPSQDPRWSPDGRDVSMFCCDDGMAAHIVHVSTGAFRELAPPDPTLEIHCGPWSADGAMLACESFGVTDPRRNGVYAIRSSDGGGLTRITANPDGDDIPSDYSPDGTRLLLARQVPTRPQSASAALFVADVDEARLRRITPWGFAEMCFCGSWSPDGRTIAFGARGSIYLVAPDGSDLRRVPIDLTGDRRVASRPGWSPDGSSIGFTLCRRKDRDCDVYTMHPDGSDVVRVTETDVGEQFSDWGPEPPSS